MRPVSFLMLLAWWAIITSADIVVRGNTHLRYTHVLGFALGMTGWLGGQLLIDNEKRRK